MKKLYCVVFSFVLVLFAINNSRASHASALDLSYQCLGNDQYLFVATFYRDCFGINAPGSLPLDISSICGFNQAYTMSLVFSTQGTDSISQLAGLCPGVLSQCMGGTLQGYEQYIYTAVVTLTDTCGDYTCATYESARNSAITNLEGADSYNLYAECHLDNTNAQCNNSPLFSIIPLSYGCINQYWTYNHGAFDPDGDSLVYTLVNPLDGPPASPIPYAIGMGFSPVYPFSTITGTFDFNPITGQMGGIPDGIQVVVISVIVDEYRNGIWVGSTSRDIQVVFDVCSNIVPEIPDGILNVIGGVQTDSTTVEVCPGAYIQFDLIGIDTNSTQNLEFSSNIAQTIPGASFSWGGTNPVYGTVSWQTQVSDSGFYVFTVVISDDGCPFSGQQVYSFTINVNPTPVDAGPDIYLCETNPTAQFNVLADEPYLWTNGQYLDDSTSATPIATFPGEGTYTFYVTGNVGGLCEKTDTLVVFVTPEVFSTSFPDPDTVCVGDPVNLTSTGSQGIGTYNYEWTSNPPGFTSSFGSTVANPLTTTTYYVEVTSGGCVTYDTLLVIVTPAPDVSFTAIPNEDCAGEIINVNYTGAGGIGYSYSWDFDGATVLSGSGSGPYDLVWNTDGTYYIILSVQDLNTCTKSDTLQIIINPNPVASFETDDIGCEPWIVHFDNNSSDGATYQWSFGDGGSSTDFEPDHVYNAGTYDVTLIVISAEGCDDTLTLTDYVTIVPVPIANFSITEAYNIPVDESQANYHFVNQSQFADSYFWDFGDGTTSTEINPEHHYSTDYEIDFMPDTFMVTLIACNDYCCDTIIIGKIIVVSYTEIYFPNAFSPNDDLFNDEFHELGQFGIVSLYYSVFNRWGQLIYETNDINGRWDGTYKEEPCEVGVYVWRATASMINGDIIEQKGNVTLVR